MKKFLIIIATIIVVFKIYDSNVNKAVTVENTQKTQVVDDRMNGTAKSTLAIIDYKASFDSVVNLFTSRQYKVVSKSVNTVQLKSPWGDNVTLQRGTDGNLRYCYFSTNGNKNFKTSNEVISYLRLSKVIGVDGSSVINGRDVAYTLNVQLYEERIDYSVEIHRVN